MRSPLLAPPPQTVEVGSGAVDLGNAVNVRIDPTLELADAGLGRLETVLDAQGIALARETGDGIDLEVRRNSRLGRAEGYRLAIDDEGLSIEATDAAGAFYALQTLSQWLGLQPEGAGETARAPHLHITDWPDLPHRGVLLDVSRSRVPTMETLFELVELFSSWKLNQLQLYTEHTFAYRGHEEVWAESSPLTAGEVQALDVYCADRHIELVPNQNSFGHLHRWLRHSRYRPLAECPDGLQHPFGTEIEPFSLCPTDPGSLDLLRDLYDQLLPCFSSRQFNVGLDETFDLGRGRSARRVAEIGMGRVYLEFLLEIHRLLKDRGRRMQFWGDILGEHPELLDEIPEDAVIMSWGYEHDHPFEAEIRPLCEREFDVYVCPGTSSWLSFAGRVDNSVSNIAGGVRAATAAGAVGCLVTDWGDRGHLQPLPISLPGFLTAACFSWNAKGAQSHEELPLEALLDAHALPGQARGLAGHLLGLGRLHRSTGAGSLNGSPLFHLVVSPELPLSHSRLDGLSIQPLEQARASLGDLRADLNHFPESLVAREIEWVAAAVDLGIDIGITRLREQATEAATELPADERRRLAACFDRLIEGHAPLWAARSRPGGADESRAVLENARSMLQSHLAGEDVGG